MNTIKWLPLESQEIKSVILKAKDLENATHILTIKILNFKNYWHPGNAKNNQNETTVQALKNILSSLSKIVKCYFKLNPKLIKKNNNVDSAILTSKKKLISDILCKKRFTLSFTIFSLINLVFKTSLHREDSRNLLEIGFGLTTLYNEFSSLSNKGFTSKFNICSNTCPMLIHQVHKISIARVVQILAQSRAEFCCHSLIDCLLVNYKPCNAASGEICSENSSVEIYKALTKHMTPPVEQNVHKKDQSQIQIKSKYSENSLKSEVIPEDQEISSLNEPTGDEHPYSSPNEYNDDSDSFYDTKGVSSLEDLIFREEKFVSQIIEISLRISPTVLGNEGIKKTKAGEIKLSMQLFQKLLGFYKNILWGDVGGYLEHIVLWWSASPLAARPPHSSQHLREWLLSLNLHDVPQLMLVALQSLADALGCHVVSTSWDKLFRLCFVGNLEATPVRSDFCGLLSIKECSQVGSSFADMLHDLVTLSNQCEVTSDYIMGAPVEDLPLVEQIPILHRLDHSIHTCRLWCLAETRKLANLWDMDAFFRVTHNDIQICLEQLSNLRFADHTQIIEKGKLGVHEYVCAKMREKLVSEIKVNIQKLKSAPDECIQVLASICGTISLAHLTMIFPTNWSWKTVTYPPNTQHSKYVHDYLDRVLLPVLKATNDKLIVNMILKIMCESWLHHIYVYKVKFTNAAAEQLLVDFEAVKTWLSNCSVISDITKRQMLNNEVLRKCEGVGKLLLHSHGDPISMHDVPQKPHSTNAGEHDTSDDCGELMPAEMYVPNQQQWLQLRATKSKTKKKRKFCCMTITY